MLTNFLAEIWGISIVIISLALLVKDGHLKKIFSAIEDDEMFMWGLIATVIGVSMILAYNVWAWQWELILTLMGWASLIKGLAMLFVPDFVKQWAKKIQGTTFMPYALIVSLIIGLVLTYMGFTAIV